MPTGELDELSTIERDQSVAPPFCPRPGTGQRHRGHWTDSSVAEIYDVIVEPHDYRADPLFAQAIYRGGYARDSAEVNRIVQRSMQDIMGARSVPTPAALENAGVPMAGMDESRRRPSITHVGIVAPGSKGTWTCLAPRSKPLGSACATTDAHLHTVGGSMDARQPERGMVLYLTGKMERLMWSFDGVKFSWVWSGNIASRPLPACSPVIQRVKPAVRR